ncbi:MAG TPA: hypothetical protein VM937_00680, partial [Burkholderiaceae bacterium]|nr:hypothetical protein [Burkholderiaceae bacterium]
MKQVASKFPTATSRTLPALVLCVTPLLSLTASAADVAPKQTTTFRTTTIDKDTNTLRAPEADEAIPAAPQGATSRSATGQSMLRSPNALRFQAQTMYGRDGSETRRLDLGRALRFSVVHRHADGSLHKDCVAGEEAVST